MDAGVNFDQYVDQLLAYARRLRRIFRDMGRLADSAGTQTPRRYHTPMHLQQVTQERDRPRDRRPPDPADERGGWRAGPDRPDDVSPPVPEATLLNEWWRSRHRGDPHPLLILGPFGSGKSVILETFTVGAAEALEQWATDSLAAGEQGRRLEAVPAVPLPVRLRALEWEAPKRELEHFRDFLARSQQVLSPNDDDGLPPTTLKALLKAGVVVPLFDGLDELPGQVGDPACGNVRESALNAIRDVCGDFYALTSRPGYEAERLIPLEHQHELGALGQSEVVTHVRRRFGIPDEVEHHRVLAAFRAAQPRVAGVLARPLFLAAWCRGMDDPMAKPPASLNDLMDELYLRLFDHRLSPPVSKDQSKALRPRLGALMAAFADQGFDTALTEAKLDSALAADGIPGDTDRRQVIEVARQVGLIRPVGLSSYFAFKIPITEYLAGRYLADLPLAGRAGSWRLVERFRRWVWTPAPYDVLDYTFDAFAHDPIGKPWGGALIAWLSNASAQEAARATDGGEVGLDDLVRPFVFAAIRFACVSPQDEVAQSFLARHAAACCHPPFDVDLWFAHLGSWPLTSEFCNLLVRELMALVATAESGESENRELDMAIAAAAGRVEPVAAAGLVERWLELYAAETGRRERGACISAIAAAAAHIEPGTAVATIEQWLRLFFDDDAEQLWEGSKSAVEGAARQLDPADASRLVEKWLRQFAADAVPVRWKWRFAICAAASRIEPIRAGELVARLGELVAAETDAEERWQWEYVIRRVLERVESRAAVELVKEWTRPMLGTLGSKVRRPSRLTIWAAALRVEPTAVTGLIEHLIGLYAAAASGDVRQALKFVISGAAQHVHPSAAEGLVERMISLIAEADDEDERREWLRTLWLPAWRVEPVAAASMVEHLIGHLAGAAKDEERGAWFTAISVAAGNVVPAAGAAMVERLVGLLAANAVDDELRESGRRAIERAAGRVPPTAAAALIETWTGLHAAATGDERLVWQGAIMGALPRVEPASIAAVVERLLGLLADVKSEWDRLAWRRAIAAAATRAAGADQLRVVNALLSLPDWLFDAFALAQQFVTVTIVSKEGQPDICEARSRCDATLLLDLHCSPDFVLEALRPFPVKDGYETAEAVQMLCRRAQEHAHRDPSLVEKVSALAYEGRSDSTRSDWFDRMIEIGKGLTEDPLTDDDVQLLELRAGLGPVEGEEPIQAKGLAKIVRREAWARVLRNEHALREFIRSVRPLRGKGKGKK